MRNGIFLGALLASVFVGGTALADRSDTETNNKPSRVQDIKERVLDKMKEGNKGALQREAARAGSKSTLEKASRSRPKGDVYGDQATRSTSKVPGAERGRNLSGTAAVNNPSEIKAMKRMINPMLGAYRTSQAAEGTDSYAGNEDSRMKSGSGSSARNLSATGAVNNPSEIKAMLKMINPMLGAYRTSQAAEGCDSYGGGDEFSPFNQSKATTKVHFKNSKGELIGETKGENKLAARNKDMREKLNKHISDKIAKAKEAK